MLVENKPNVPGTEHYRDQAEFLWIEDITIIGRTIANCAQCAWNKDRYLYQTAKLALWTGMDNIVENGGCFRLRSDGV